MGFQFSFWRFVEKWEASQEAVGKQAWQSLIRNDLIYLREEFNLLLD